MLYLILIIQGFCKEDVDEDSEESWTEVKEQHVQTEVHFTDTSHDTT